MSEDLELLFMAPVPLKVVFAVKSLSVIGSNGLTSASIYLLTGNFLWAALSSGNIILLLGFLSRIILIPLEDGQKENLIGYNFTFFDIHSIKAKQFGFTTKLNNGKTLTFLGDEPYNPLCRKHVENSDWLLSEAFCLYRDRDIFKPYEKHHSTVKEACETATQLSIKNLVLWHTEDQNITHRKELYTAEGKIYYNGNLYVPNDLEVLEL